MTDFGNPLPGDLTPEQQVARMIRVNHAGEYGALRIYAGQLAVLKDKVSRETIAHMMAQEQEHLTAFEQWIAARRVRPTALMPLWHVAGWALGAATAMLGEKAAMACTVAVEDVIDKHYAEQEDTLGTHEPELKHAISRFRADEREHHDTALEHGAEQAPAYALLSAAVGGATKLAIWLSKRV